MKGLDRFRPSRAGGRSKMQAAPVRCPPAFARAVAAVGVALGITATGCSEEVAGAASTTVVEGCINGAKGLDCRARIEVRHVATGKLVPAAGTVDVPVGALQVSALQTVEFTITNNTSTTTGAALRIVDIRVEGNDAQSFECFDGTGGKACAAMKDKWKRVGPAGAEPGQGLVAQENFRLRYKHGDPAKRAANVCFTLIGDPDWKDATKPMCFGVQTVLGKPQLGIAPNDVVFPYVQVGKSECRKLTLSNTGDALLLVPKLDFETAEATFTLTDGKTVWKTGAPVVFDPPRELQPGKSMEFEVCFVPTDEKAKFTTLKVQSNDPATPIGGKPVNLKANSAVPCLEIKPWPKLNFGAVVVGGSAPGKIVVKSCGNEVLEISAVTLKAGSSDNFKVDWQGVPGVDPKTGPSVNQPLLLATNESVDLKAVYTPSQVNPVDPSTQSPTPDVGTLVFAANVVSKGLSLEGVGVKKACPEAKVGVTSKGVPVEQVEPQTILQLIGDKSVAPGGGTIASYTWSLKKEPKGSQGKFVPSADFPNPTLAVNAAGEYQICLKVQDASGLDSCEATCVTVLVVPSSYLHVELLWKTPGDKDETDEGPAAGADVDLHVTHPFASGPDLDCDGAPDPWFHSVFDTFWFNPLPEWGKAGDTADNPRLDRDDTDGGGPENINFDIPEGTPEKPFAYPLGVHYWNDHGYGETYATVKVYVLGNLAASYLDVRMDLLDMWYVGKINWPNAEAGGTKPVVEACKQSGDACLVKKDPGNPKAGKMWDAAGKDLCITKCYIHPATPQGGLTACKK
ncbi:MAG: choice-of-anchor D domain-containing protein [Myxococcales bacterium]|nr:choice-of-anchor D domain-containing protein [Myxococcales bacterium]